MEERLLKAAEYDTGIENKFIEGLEVKEEELQAALKKACREGKLTPVIFSSAKTGGGMRELLEAVAEYLPEADTNPCTPLSGVVYKVEHAL
jgi:translation elongation factor EF-G